MIQKMFFRMFLINLFSKKVDGQSREMDMQNVKVIK
jgi:hypothetical protein